MQYVAYSIDVAYSIRCRYAFVTIPVDNFISQKVNIWSQAGARFALVWQYIYMKKRCVSFVILKWREILKNMQII